MIYKSRNSKQIGIRKYVTSNCLPTFKKQAIIDNYNKIVELYNSDSSHSENTMTGVSLSRLRKNSDEFLLPTDHEKALFDANAQKLNEYMENVPCHNMQEMYKGLEYSNTAVKKYNKELEEMLNTANTINKNIIKNERIYKPYYLFNEHGNDINISHLKVPERITCSLKNIKISRKSQIIKSLSKAEEKMKNKPKIVIPTEQQLKFIQQKLREQNKELESTLKPKPPAIIENLSCHNTTSTTSRTLKLHRSTQHASMKLTNSIFKRTKEITLNKVSTKPSFDSNGTTCHNEYGLPTRRHTLKILNASINCTSYPVLQQQQLNLLTSR